METKWYVIRSVNGKEKKAVEQLGIEFKNAGYGDKVKQIIIPLEKVSKNRKGKKYTSTRNYYPGYILIEVDPNVIGEIKNINKRINYVIEFLGGDSPIALRKDEVDRILGKMDELLLSDDSSLDYYIIGEKVKIIDGPFNGFIAEIEKVFSDKKRVQVGVNIFGRKTPVELDFTQINKQD